MLQMIKATFETFGSIAEEPITSGRNNLKIKTLQKLLSKRLDSRYA